MQGKRSVLLCVFFLAFIPLFALKTDKKGKDTDRFSGRWYLGVNLGPNFYFGDLNPDRKINSSNLSMAGGIFGEYQASNVFGLKMQLMAAGLNGMTPFDSIGKTWERAFTGLLLEASMNAIVNFNNLFSPYRPKRLFFIYGIAGIGFAGWYSKSLNKVYDINTLSTDSPLQNFNAGVVLPVGVGVFYTLKNKYRFGAEWTFRTYLSDKVDNVISNYKFDVVDYLAFGISINLGGKSKKTYRLHDYPLPSAPVYVSPAPRVEAPPVVPVIEPADYEYVVQVYAFARYIKSTEWVRKRHKISYPVKRVKEESLYRYILGPYKNVQEARRVRDEMIQKGIHDTFIIAYKDGSRHHTVTD